jgi:hypothetical protein
MEDSEIDALVGVDSKGIVKDEEIKGTIRNIFNWSSEGKSEKEISQYLNMDLRDFKSLCKQYPIFLGAMSKGKAMAKMMVSASMYELAIGGKKIKKLVPVTTCEYNENGKMISKTTTYANVETELPPDFNAQKYILSRKDPKNWGDDVVIEEEKIYKKQIEPLTSEDKARLVKLNKARKIKEAREEMNE